MAKLSSDDNSAWSSSSFYPLRIENDLVPTAADIEAKITSKTKVLLLNSPGNPSGAIIPESELVAILQVAKKHNLWVISDEVYDEIYFDKPPASLQPLDEEGRVISVFSFSKTYAMTGWRVGYLTGPMSIVSHILRAQEPITSCVNSVAQKPHSLQSLETKVAYLKCEMRTQNVLLL